MGRPRGWAAAATGRPRCGRLAGRRWRGVSIGNGPGRGSRSDCPEAGRVRGHRAGRPAGPGAAGRRPPDRDQRPPGPCPWLHPAHRSTSNASGRAETQSSGASGSWIRPARVWPAECQNGASRLVSLHDPDARPIRKGRLGRPVEFGYKAQVLDNADGIVLDDTVMVANPPDAPLLAPAIGRVIGRTGKPPRVVAADRAMASLSSSRSWPTLAWPGSPSHAAAAPVPPARGSSASVASVGWSSGAPAARAHQLPQAPLRLGPHPHGRHPRDPHLVRPRCVHPQPGQDQRAARGQAPQGSMSAKAPAQASTTTQPAADHLITKRSSGPSKFGQIRERGQLRSIEVRSLAPADG